MTLEEISQALAHLAAELHNIDATLKTAAPLVAPVAVPVAPAVAPAVLPPRPNGSPTAGAANHLADILYGHNHPPVPTVPQSQSLPPEVLARYQADQKAYIDAFRSMGPLGAFHLHLQPPNLNNYRLDHAYQWPGNAILANARPGHNPVAL